MEFWCRRNAVDSLAWSVAAATSLFDICGRSDGTRLHKISARSYDMGRIGCHFDLGFSGCAVPKGTTSCIS